MKFLMEPGHGVREGMEKSWTQASIRNIYGNERKIKVLQSYTIISGESVMYFKPNKIVLSVTGSP